MDILVLSAIRVVLVAIFSRYSSSFAFNEGFTQGFEGRVPKEQGKMRARNRTWNVRSSSVNDLCSPLLGGSSAHHEESHQEDKNAVIEKNVLEEVEDTSFTELLYSISPKDATLLGAFLSCTLFQVCLSKFQVFLIQ